MEYIPAKTIVTKTKSGDWFGVDYNMNIYRGCCHGCIYCDSRSACYRIQDFDRVRAKKDALMIIRDDLRRKVRTGVVGTGAMSDPYNPFEAELRLSRNALELLYAFHFGVAITTKSTLVTRDVDVLQDIQKQSPILVQLTITTAEDELCRKIEPGVPVSSERFRALRTLAEGGIYCGVLLMPILPFINDTEDNVRTLVRLSYENGAKFIYPAFGMTLRTGQREYYYRQLDAQFPGLREKYVARYGERYHCPSPRAKRLYGILAEECQRLGLRYRMRSIVEDYKRGYAPPQLSFF